jgi:hypothetical protein
MVKEVCSLLSHSGVVTGSLYGLVKEVRCIVYSSVFMCMAGVLASLERRLTGATNLYEHVL